MYAIVDIAGQQFKVEKGKKVFVHRLPGEVGAEVSFDKVLLIGNEDKINIGEPYVNNAVVTAQILSHLRGDKIQVFKKKRRKGYQVLKGHRQEFTEILIDEISETGLAKKAAPKKEAETIVEVPLEEEATTIKSKAPAKTTEKKAEKVVQKPGVKDTKPKEKNTTKTASNQLKPKVSKKPASKEVPESTSGVKQTKSKTTTRSAESKAKPAIKKTTEKKQGTAGKKPTEKKK